MYKQNCYTLKTLDKMPKKGKKAILDNCEGEFVRFLMECVHNMLLGNLSGVKRKQLEKHVMVLEQLNKKKNKKYRNDQRKLFASDKGLKLLTYITPPIISK